MNATYLRAIISIKAGLLGIVVAGLCVGCGGDDGAGGSDEEEVRSCESYRGATIETGERLRDDHGIHFLDYTSQAEAPHIDMATQNEAGEKRGRFTLSVGGIEDRDYWSAHLNYSSPLDEDIDITTQMGSMSKGYQAAAMQAPDLFIINTLDIGGEQVGSQMRVRVNESNIHKQSPDNPLIEVEAMSLFSTGGQTLEVKAQGERVVTDDEIEAWAQENIPQEWAENENAGVLKALLGDESMLSEFSDGYGACSGKHRSGRLGAGHGALHTPCHTQDQTVDFALGLVGSSVTKFIPAEIGLATEIHVMGKENAISAENVGSLVGIGVLVIGGLIGGLAGVVIAGVAILAVAAILLTVVAFSTTLNPISCGNPLVRAVNGVAFAFRDTGEFIWYDHRARDSLQVQIRQSSHPGSECADGARIEAVALGSAAHRIGLYVDRDRRLWIDGEAQAEDQYFWVLDEGIQIERRSITQGAEARYIVTGSNQERVRIDVFSDRLDIELEIPEQWQDGARGIVGHQGAGGVEGLRLRGGEVLSEPVNERDLYLRFGASWRVAPEESLFDYGVNESPADFSTSNYPMAPRRMDALAEADRLFAYKICATNGDVEDPTLLRHCMLDVGCTGDVSYMHTYRRLEGPERELEVVDEQGRFIGGRFDDEQRDAIDISADAAPFSSDLPNWDAARQASCPSDIENGAESVGLSQIRTIDGLVYPFRAAGEFVLVESRASDSLAVHVRQESTGGQPCPHARKNTAVGVRMGEHRLAFYADASGQIYIDGEPAQLVSGFKVLTGGQTILQTEANKVLMEWPDGTWLHITFKGDRLDIRFNAHYTRLGKLQGLFGQFNGYPDNDIAYRDGSDIGVWEPSTIHGEYADSWRISQAESLLDYDEGETTADYTSDSVPAMYMTVDDVPSGEQSSAGQACEQAGVTHPEIMEACIIDVYCTGDPDVAADHGEREEPAGSDEIEWVEFVPGSGDHCCHVDCPGGADPECDFVCGADTSHPTHPWCQDDCPSAQADCVDMDPENACLSSQFEAAFEDADISAYICASRCVQQQQWQCIDDDGCCPAGGHCTSAMDNDCQTEPHIGSGCVEDEDCATVAEGEVDPSSVLCLPEEDLGMFGGVCVSYCADDTHCPEDSHCAAVPLHLGGIAETFGNSCVRSCSDDSDCEREGYGCYDANQDGRTECWHEGTDSGDFGDSCELSRDCGDIGQWAVCPWDSAIAIDDEGTLARYCTQRCDVEGVTCPSGWDCGSQGVCVEPIKNDVGGPCEDTFDCASGKNNLQAHDICLRPDHPTAIQFDLDLEGGYCGLICDEQSDCPDGTRCTNENPLLHHHGQPIDFTCILECDDDSDCERDNFECYDATGDGLTECWEVGTGPGDYGDECERGADCGLGQGSVCHSLAFGGAASRCTTTCMADSTSCPIGYGCTGAVCLVECENNDDCPDSSVCIDDAIETSDGTTTGGCL